MRYLIYPHTLPIKLLTARVFSLYRPRAVTYFSFETVNGEQGASGEASRNGEERALRRLLAVLIRKSVPRMYTKGVPLLSAKWYIKG